VAITVLSPTKFALSIKDGSLPVGTCYWAAWIGDDGTVHAADFHREFVDATFGYDSRLGDHYRAAFDAGYVRVLVEKDDHTVGFETDEDHPMNAKHASALLTLIALLTPPTVRTDGDEMPMGEAVKFLSTVR
jgi:hypothetical protein